MDGALARRLGYAVARGLDERKKTTTMLIFLGAITLQKKSSHAESVRARLIGTRQICVR